MHFDFVAADTASKLRVICKDNDTGIVIDLTGATVKLRWRNAGDTATVEVSMNVVDAVNGVAEHRFTTGQLFAGVMIFDVEITGADGYIIHNVNVIDASVRNPI